MTARGIRNREGNAAEAERLCREAIERRAMMPATRPPLDMSSRVSERVRP